jgi:hypothetical protein
MCLGQDKSKINVWCLRKDKNKLLIKIENKGIVPIYVPVDFVVDYSYAKHTIYLKSLNNEAFEKSSYYYSRQFGNKIITDEPIRGLIADSIKKTEESLLYNQFRAPRLIKIEPHSHLIRFETAILPFDIRKAVFTIYTSDFTKKDYFESDFLKFEKTNAFFVSTNIYEVVQ